MDQKPTAEIRFAAEGARADGRALTNGTRSVSDRGGESTLTERAQRQRGNGRLQGSEGVRAVRSRSDGEGSEGVRRGVRRGSEGSEPFDQDRTGKSQTGTDERLWVALTGGPGRQVHVREAVFHGPDRGIPLRAHAPDALARLSAPPTAAHPSRSDFSPSDLDRTVRTPRTPFGPPFGPPRTPPRPILIERLGPPRTPVAVRFPSGAGPARSACSLPLCR